MEFIFDEKCSDVQPRKMMMKLIMASFKLVAWELDILENHRDVKIRCRSRLLNQLRGPARQAGSVDQRWSANPDKPFLVNLTEQSALGMIDTIAHEMVHVQQILQGRLVSDLAARSVTFDGKLYETGDIMSAYNLSGEDEGLMPWEQEAYDQMFPLARRVYLRLDEDMQVWVLRENAKFLAG